MANRNETLFIKINASDRKKLIKEKFGGEEKETHLISTIVVGTL